MPSALDVQRTFGTADPFSKLRGLTLDFKAAHKSQKVRPEEQGTLLFRVADKLYHYTVCHFGARFSAYWWQRTGSLLSCAAFTHCSAITCIKPGSTWTTYLHFSAKATCTRPWAVWSPRLAALKAPISWKKAQVGTEVTWCGWTFCLHTETVALVHSKLEKLRQQLHKLSKGSKVAKKDLEACLGLLNWATTLSPHMRSFMSCLYIIETCIAPRAHCTASLRRTAFYDCLDRHAKLSATPLGSWLPRNAQLLEVGAIKVFSKADVPRVPPSHKHQWVRLADPTRSELHLKQDSKFALTWLSLCFQHEQPRSLCTSPLAPCLSAADAFADKHRMGIGGWLSTATDFIWYSEIFTDEEVRQEWPPAHRLSSAVHSLF